MKTFCPHCGNVVEIGKYYPINETKELLEKRNEKLKSMINTMIKMLKPDMGDVYNFLQRIEFIKEDDWIFNYLDNNLSWLKEKGGMNYIGAVVAGQYRNDKNREETIIGNTKR